MEKRVQETKKVKNPIAHSNFKRGLNDYNDGGSGLNATHYLGNEDYESNLCDENGVLYNEKLDGKEAKGNDLHEDDEDI